MTDISESEISHKGVISDINSKVITVKIISTAACVSCHSKSSCGAADMLEKIIEIETPPTHNYKIGDEVEVVLNEILGLKAVLVGYILPFGIVVITLILMLKITDNQGIAGVVSLLALVPFYMILFLFRKKHKKTFNFKIK